MIIKLHQTIAGRNIMCRPVEYTLVQSPNVVSTRLCWGNSIDSSTTRGTSSSQSNTKSSVVYDTMRRDNYLII